MSNVGGSQNAKEKVEKKEDEKKEVKLKGDFGYNCNYCNGHNHLAKDCIIQKTEEKKDKVRNEGVLNKDIGRSLCSNEKYFTHG